MFAALLLFADLLVGTWNMNWFPSGRAEHSVPVPIAEQRMNVAARSVRDELARNRRPGDHVVIFLQELRSEQVASNFVARIGIPGLKLASASAFRNFDGRLGWQQVAVATDLPILDASYSWWRKVWIRSGVTVMPPRGYAYALLDGGKAGPIACYSVHLKSNYGAKTAEDRESNIHKREYSIRQLVALAEPPKKGRRKPRNQAQVVGVSNAEPFRVLVGGDFNTDPFSGDFKDEKTVSLLTDAGFKNCFQGAPLFERSTHPGRGRYPDSTLDFVFHRGFEVQSRRWLAPIAQEGDVTISDHRMVWVVLKTPDSAGRAQDSVKP